MVPVVARARPRARARHRAPRPQAREHLRHRGRRRQGARLRHREAARRRATPQTRPGEWRAHARSRSGGTLPYMSPEQFGVGDVDHRSDLWAVGIMLFEMLRRAASAAAAHAGGAAPARRLPRRADAVARRRAAGSARTGSRSWSTAASRNGRSERIATAAELLAELEPLLPGATGSAGAIPTTSPYPGLDGVSGERRRSLLRPRAPTCGRWSRGCASSRWRRSSAPSGVGKSSFVRAGVVPALKAAPRGVGGVHRCGPGASRCRASPPSSQPLTTQSARAPDRRPTSTRISCGGCESRPAHLGAVLRTRAAQRSQQVLLFVDQFEELYTLVPDDGAAARVHRLSLGRRRRRRGAAARPRARCAPTSSIASARIAGSSTSSRAGSCSCSRCRRDGLARGARAAARACSATASRPPALLDDMLDALAATPGSLPLLQFAGGEAVGGARSQRRQCSPRRATARWAASRARSRARRSRWSPRSPRRCSTLGARRSSSGWSRRAQRARSSTSPSSRV